ncbi:hypothetical protein [Sulfuritortus calidifontis]|uniref:hypothetical protein n=1 Tax=Sulfuritortus calidifontis TaxID=1914471 RepID=UPI000F838025|nr:hypothetical protein [Sulfuritortus calidifontis]
MTDKKKAATGFGTRAASNTVCSRNSSILRRIASLAAVMVWFFSPVLAAWLSVQGGPRHD